MVWGHGAALLCVEYRGYGWSTGTAQLLTLATDAEAVIDLLPKAREIGTRCCAPPLCTPVFASDTGWLQVTTALMPQSCCLGGLLALCRQFTWPPSIRIRSRYGAWCSGIVARRPHTLTSVLKGLAIESGIAKLMELPLVAMMETFLPPEIMTTLRALDNPDPFRNVDKIAHVKAPLLIIHGVNDQISPVAQGDALFKACASEYVLCEGAAACSNPDTLRVASDKRCSRRYPELATMTCWLSQNPRTPKPSLIGLKRYNPPKQRQLPRTMRVPLRQALEQVPVHVRALVLAQMEVKLLRAREVRGTRSQLPCKHRWQHQLVYTHRPWLYHCQ